MRTLTLAVLGLISSVAFADATRQHVQQLHLDLVEITSELERLADTPSEGNAARAMSSHLDRMESHLKLVRTEICGLCETTSLPASGVEQAQTRCAGYDVRPSLSLREYESLMRRETHWMHDRLLRMTTERSMFERQRLLRQYYDRVLRTIDAAGPSCASEQQSRAMPVDRHLQTPVVGFITTDERATPQDGAPTRTRAPLVCEHEGFVAPG